MPAGSPDTTLPNGQDGAIPPGVAGYARKTKAKKPVDMNASKLLKHRIAQLEQDAAGEKDQEAEIEREVKKASREMMQQVSKMTDMAKIEHLTRKSSELLADMRRMERENQKNKKRGDALQKEKDANRTELSKTVGLKDKLEKLCRELQKDNNKYKNDNKTFQDNLKHNSASYDEKYSILLSKLEGIQEEKDHPRKQVVEIGVETLFRNRFKSFIEQYELRELHFHSQMRTKELEVQYHMARYEREKKNAEAEAAKARQLQEQVRTFTKTETELRNQLNVYVDKFKQVEDTLNNSNDLFLTFRKEMEEMSKKTKRLEKENETMKRKHEATNANIISMAEEREAMRTKTAEATKKTGKLISIIEQMQQQGRKVPPGMAATLESCYSDSNGQVDGDGSDYSDEGDDDEQSEEFDDDTEEEPQAADDVPPRPCGPERPPVSAPQAATNGH
ncbi:hypothetical protein BN1708_012212 [Verticillium longisporum]|uniref:Alpha-taxilin n=1 Tax=Verticillium longisporum TaxID=100787 RepID=A0A0G4L7U0_VERLO|nr:hypothetical protein BN1708_012212 [Verticillium longisporum]